jgi:hypothetical protein
MTARPADYEQWPPDLRRVCERAEQAVETSRLLRDEIRRNLDAWWRDRTARESD